MPTDKPSRLLDAVVTGQLKTEELLLTAEAVNTISDLHDELVGEIERLSEFRVGCVPAENPYDAVTLIITVPKHKMLGCRTVGHVKDTICGLALQAFSDWYREDQDGTLRQDVQRMETGHDDKQAEPGPVDAG